MQKDKWCRLSVKETLASDTTIRQIFVARNCRLKIVTIKTTSSLLLRKHVKLRYTREDRGARLKMKREVSMNE